MLYLTAVYPAEQIARRRRGKPPSSEEERLWRIANNTLFSIAEYTRRWAGHGAWAPLNGLVSCSQIVATRLFKRIESIPNLTHSWSACDTVPAVAACRSADRPDLIGRHA